MALHQPLNPASTAPEVLVHGSTLDAADVGAPHLPLALSEGLLQLTIAGGNLGVADEACQQVNTVHCRVAGQGLGQLNYILDLQGGQREQKYRWSVCICLECNRTTSD